ncbi:uncharacterized protein [Argopecten irradians]|uniref:uncharacterized protein n=1 Tax=Argopecten irradians TaxID=31199 RepID=UPI0037128B4B
MISDLYDDMKDSTLKTNSEIKSMKKTVEMVDSNTKQIETVVMTNKDNQQAILDTIEDIQCRSMKQSLVFHGLREDKHEDTESRLKDFIYYELCIEKNIEFTNVHRFGRHVFGKSRPIVAVFMYQKDLQLVRKNAHYLKDTNFWINEQFPKAVEQRRRELYPILRSHKRAGHQVKLVRDRLYIDNQLYDGQETPSRSFSEVVLSSNVNNGRIVKKRSRVPSSPSMHNNAPLSSRPRLSSDREPEQSRVPPSTPGQPVEERRVSEGNLVLAQSGQSRVAS